MRLVLVLLVVGGAIVVLRIYFALKSAHADDPQHQKTSKEEKTVVASAGIAAAVGSAVPPETTQEGAVRKEMWVDSHYCWVVLCKNHWFHRRHNLFYRHRIPLAETDPVATRPSLEGRFSVRCDDCQKEFLYDPKEVLKFEQELPDAFAPHPLFRDC
jgi:hypothetical protein